MSKYSTELPTGGMIYNLCDSKNTFEFSDIKVAAVLTMIDKLPGDTRHDYSKAFSSKEVERCVKKVAHTLMIEENLVLPVSLV